MVGHLAMNYVGGLFTSDIHVICLFLGAKHCAFTSTYILPTTQFSNDPFVDI